MAWNIDLRWLSIFHLGRANMVIINTWWPSDAIWIHRFGSTLAQVMAWCHDPWSYLAPSHYLNQCWFIVNWTLGTKLKWSFNKNTKLFFNENASENIVCEMAVILSRGRWVNEVIVSNFLWLSQSTILSMHSLFIWHYSKWPIPLISCGTPEYLHHHWSMNVIFMMQHLESCGPFY